MPNKKASFE